MTQAMVTTTVVLCCVSHPCRVQLDRSCSHVTFKHTSHATAQPVSVVTAAAAAAHPFQCDGWKVLAAQMPGRCHKCIMILIKYNWYCCHWLPNRRGYSCNFQNVVRRDAHQRKARPLPRRRHLLLELPRAVYGGSAGVHGWLSQPPDYT